MEPPSVRPVGLTLTERDRSLLAFAAEHRLLIGAHAAALHRTSTLAAPRRLRALTRAGYLRSDLQLAGQRWFQIERRGLAALGSQLPRPRPADLASYEHDAGLAWLWLAARGGSFGELHTVISERQMRSEDPRCPPGADRYGVRLPGVGPRGGERHHYPDLLLETAGGHRVAVELELSTKSARRREEILGGYAIDGRIDAVLYLVDRPGVGQAIERSAARVGVSSLIHVQRVAFGPGAGGISPGRSPERTQTRSPANAGARGASATPAPRLPGPRRGEHGGGAGMIDPR